MGEQSPWYIRRLFRAGSLLSKEIDIRRPQSRSFGAFFARCFLQTLFYTIPVYARGSLTSRNTFRSSGMVPNPVSCPGSPATSDVEKALRWYVLQAIVAIPSVPTSRESRAMPSIVHVVLWSTQDSHVAVASAGSQGIVTRCEVEITVWKPWAFMDSRQWTKTYR